MHRCNENRSSNRGTRTRKTTADTGAHTETRTETRTETDTGIGTGTGTETGIVRETVIARDGAIETAAHVENVHKTHGNANEMTAEAADMIDSPIRHAHALAPPPHLVTHRIAHIAVAVQCLPIDDMSFRTMDMHAGLLHVPSSTSAASKQAGRQEQR